MTFSERNKARSESPKGFNHKLDSWSLSDWMTALTGEVGEAANIIKKLNRIRDGNGQLNEESPAQLHEMLADELADIAIYLDLLAQASGHDLETIRECKFNRTSKKIGYTEECSIHEWKHQQT
jgi:NTP pyrophosphatase (non-canonical NTP hydrolase)